MILRRFLFFVDLRGLEGNPHLTPRLRLLEARLRSEGFNTSIQTETLAWHTAGTLDLRLDRQDPSSGLASSVCSSLPSMVAAAEGNQDDVAVAAAASSTSSRYEVLALERVRALLAATLVPAH